MSFKHLTNYLKRSVEYAAKTSINSLKGNQGEWQKQQIYFNFSKKDSLNDWIVGTDEDLGGSSIASLEFIPENDSNPSHLSLHGNLIVDSLKDNMQGGYIGIRSKLLPFTLAHTPTFDSTLFRYLAIKCRGDAKQWFVNIQTNSPVQHDLYQHRLVFDTPGEWETVLIPFRDFVLTNHGWIQKRQIPMERNQIRTIGFSLVRQPGPFKLDIAEIKAFNTERTLGDLDLLKSDEFIDENGIIHKKQGDEVKDVSFTWIESKESGQKDVDSGFKLRGTFTKKQKEDREWLDEYYKKEREGRRD